MPDEPEVVGLLALMLLIDARRPARAGPDGSLVPLPEQDRDAVGPRADRRGAGARALVPAAERARPYQLQAAINAVHSDAPSAAQTDWLQILALYDQLMALVPTRWWPSTGPWPWPRPTAPRPRWPLSITSTSTATTCSMPCAPTCCAASAARTRQRAAYDAAIALTGNGAEQDLSASVPVDAAAEGR